MNYLDSTVTQILSEPYEPEWKGETKDPDIWLVDVEYRRYGELSRTALVFIGKTEAENLKTGHVFLSRILAN